MIIPDSQDSSSKTLPPPLHPSSSQTLERPPPVVRHQSLPERRSPRPTPPPPIHPTIRYGDTSPLLPPQYTIAEIPPETMTYSFIPQPGNTMVLFHLPSSRTKYNISVSMNCFTPTSHITTVSNADGRFIGDFEIGFGPHSVKNTVCLKGNEFPIDTVLQDRKGSGFSKKSPWVWKTSDINPSSSVEQQTTIYWDDSTSNGTILTCFSSKEKIISNLLAKFTPKLHPRRQGRQVEYNKLEVTPEGHRIFDDIIMSLLILERLRTNPT